MPIQGLSTPILLELFANTPEKVAEDGLTAWAPASLLEIWMELQAPALPVVTILRGVNQ